MFHTHFRFSIFETKVITSFQHCLPHRLIPCLSTILANAQLSAALHLLAPQQLPPTSPFQPQLSTGSSDFLKLFISGLPSTPPILWCFIFSFLT